MSLSLALAWRRLRPRAPEETTMPTATARPNWRNLVGRDWFPVTDEPQAIQRIYTEGNRLLIVVHMPSGAAVDVYQRNQDGSQGAWREFYWLPEPESEWPRTKALLAVMV